MTPDDLGAARARYQEALLANDLVTMAESFEPGSDCLRGDANAILVGHEAVTGFRSGRGGAAAHRVEDAVVRSLTDDLAVVMERTHFEAGGWGTRTQVWRHSDGRWRIVAAQVATPPPRFDRSVWRAVGDPLHPATADGPLNGMDVAVKDLFAVAGHPTGGGVPAFAAEAEPAERDAPAVAQLRRAGAALAGIAATDEFAFSLAGENPHYGTPPNAAAPGRIPGGSTSGPAAAVALGQASIGLGTDTAGSIRVPASYQGLWGLRTSHGRVDAGGVLALAPSFDSVGWLTRSLGVLRAVAEDAYGLAPQGWAPDALLIIDDLLERADAGIRDRLLSLARRSGLPLRTARLSEFGLASPDDLSRIFSTIQGREAWAEHGPWIERHPGALGAAVSARFASASQVTREAAADASGERQRFRHLLLERLADAALLLPTTPGPAPLLGHDDAEATRIRQATLPLTCVAPLIGGPALSAPWLESGSAPVGVSLIGPPDADADLLVLAARLAPSAGR